MRFLLPLLVVATPALAAPAPVEWATLIRKHGFREHQVGLMVIDSTGRVLASVRADEPFAPASNQKVITAAIGLEVLGADFVYTTTLSSDRAPEGDVLRGDLVLSGDGDPNISGRFTRDDPTVILRRWAREFRKKGLRTITGDLLIDDFAFDDQRFLPTWQQDQWSRWYTAQIGALNFNDNCVDVTVVPGPRSAKARYRLSPPTRYVTVENDCKTVALSSSTRRPRIVLDRVRGSNRIILDGSIATGTRSWAGNVTVDDPGLYLGTVLTEVFASEGVEIRGAVVRDRKRLPPAASRVLYHRHTSGLQLDIPVILRNSQNLHAEVLLKAIGRSSGAVGSIASGRRVVLRELERLGIDAAGVRIVDGSGLSPENRLTPSVLARLLHRIRDEPYFPLFRDSLPLGGKTGTLSRRFRRRDVRGRVLAKTGYISGVSALSGYVFPTELEPVERPSVEAATQSSATQSSATQSSPTPSPSTPSPSTPSPGTPSPGTPSPGTPSPATRSQAPFWTFSILVNGFPARRGLVAALELQEDVVRQILRRMAVE